MRLSTPSLVALSLVAAFAMAFERSYEMIMAGDSTARVDSTTLTLTSSRGGVRFGR